MAMERTADCTYRLVAAKLDILCEECLKSKGGHWVEEYGNSC